MCFATVNQTVVSHIRIKG